jgi:fructose 1,6-bisphosphatase
MQLAPIEITSQPSQPIVLGTLFDKSKSKSSDHDLILFPFFVDAGATRFLIVKVPRNEQPSTFKIAM